ncbi:MAG: hypothetical protein WCH74_11240 [Chloroflexota bacterium]
MPAPEVDGWLRSRRTTFLEGLPLRPVDSPFLPGSSLSISRGQAEVFYLAEPSGTRWILKKFHRGRSLDRAYLEAVAGLLPGDPAFECGSRRRVVDGLDAAAGYAPPALAAWIGGTVLMPRVKGLDWAALADRIRDGACAPDPAQRARLCRALADAVGALEAAGVSHRDLSSGNVLVEPDRWDVSLIDWDSVFHASLRRPANTTLGTNGYMSPVIPRSAEATDTTWAPHADRFALAVLCAEFLAMDRGSPLAADGGLFTNEDFERRTPIVESIAGVMAERVPGAGDLFVAAVAARDPAGFPSPGEWTATVSAVAGPPLRPPRLRDMPIDDLAYLGWLDRQQPQSPMWAAPGLAELPSGEVVLPPTPLPAGPAPAPAPSLPRDPFAP